MARYKPYSYDQIKLIPISFRDQILPGSFEYTLSVIIDEQVDLSVFEDRYCNDVNGAPAYDPAILLKAVLYAYSRGIVSSREIARCCRDNVIFMALSADSQPHFTTIAGFVSRMSAEITALFGDVLLICDELGLIGREMFAVDGCKLPSNASKEWSGTKEELGRKKAKMQRAVDYLIERHREADRHDENDNTPDPPARGREQQQIETLRARIAKLSAWLAENEDKPGRSAKPKKSNLTDNDSALMKTSHGTLQGYNGVAAVDAKHQVVVEAQAHGEGQEHGLLAPMIEGIRERFHALGDWGVFGQARVTADAGFHSEANVKYLFDERIDAYVADTRLRQRDPRFADPEGHYQQEKQHQRQRKSKPRFTPADFVHDAANHTCYCPAGKKLYLKHRNAKIGAHVATCYQGAKRDCAPCVLRARCLKSPTQKTTRQVYFFRSRADAPTPNYSERMRQKIDSDTGRAIYSGRLGTVEPVFGNLRATLRLDRFTLRGKKKVDTQWKLYCLVHNLLKIHQFGYEQ